MLGKLDGSNNLIPVPYTGELTISGETHTVSGYNMLDVATLKAQGWMDVIETPVPEPETGYEWRAIYEEVSGEIVQTWVSYELPTGPTYADCMDFIEGMMKSVGY